MRITLDDIADKAQGARRYDKYLAIICPFHEDNKPSMMVYEDGWYNCLACGAKGRLSSLYDVLAKGGQRRYHVENRYPSLPHLPEGEEERADLFWSAHYLLTQNAGLEWYLRMRGVEGRIEVCKLGWYDGWYTVPVTNREGNIKGGVLRAGSATEKATGYRYYIPAGQPTLMYCPNWNMLERRKTLAVVYGIFDALVLSDLGYAVVTTSGGKHTFDPEWLDFWRKPILVIPDKGEEDTAKMLVSKLDWRGKVHYMKYKDGLKDPADYVKETVGCREDLVKELDPLLGG